MLDPEVLREIASGPPDDMVTFVIEWREQPSETLFPPSSSKRERLNRLKSFYISAKAPLVDKLSRAGVSVKDLPTSSQLSATAPAHTWRGLRFKLENDPRITVLPNRMYTAV